MEKVREKKLPLGNLTPHRRLEQATERPDQVRRLLLGKEIKRTVGRLSRDGSLTLKERKLWQQGGIKNRGQQSR